MSIAKKLIPRAGGEYKSAAPWAYRYRSAIAQLKTMGTQAAGTLTVTPSRASCFQNGHIFFKVSTTMPTVNSWANDVIFIFDYDDPDSMYYNMRPDEKTDLLGKQAGFHTGFFGSHVWEEVGTYSVKCFAFNSSNNTWDETTTTITVTDPLDSIPLSKRFVVSASGDFSGAPAADNTYIDIDAAMNAFTAAASDAYLILRRGETYNLGAIPTVKPNTPTANYIMGAFGVGDRPKIIIDFGGTPFGTANAIFSIRKCASFTVTGIFWRGLYNSRNTPQMVEGELVAAGHAGGTNTCTDIEVIYSGWGGTAEAQEDCNNVTVYNCKVQGLRKTMYSRTGMYHAVINNHLSEWCDFGVFHSYSVGFSMLGNDARVFDDCVHLGQGKISNARPREVWHGMVRSEQSVDFLCCGNDGATSNGWFSDNTCQPVIRLHSDGTLNGNRQPSLYCANNNAAGGDGVIIFNPANNNISSAFTNYAVIESNILSGTKFQYGGTQAAHAAIFRNNILLQPNIPQVSPNDLWQSLSFFKNNGVANGTDPAVFDQPAFAYSNTIVNELPVQDGTFLYAPITNNPNGWGNTAGVAFTNLTLSNNLGYAPNLAVTSVNQVNPNFDDTYNPSTVGFVNTGTAQLGNVLDIYCNIRHATTPNLGAVEATTTI